MKGLWSLDFVAWLAQEPYQVGIRSMRNIKTSYLSEILDPSTGSGTALRPFDRLRDRRLRDRKAQGTPFDPSTSSGTALNCLVD